MKELPVDPFALHARMMDALIGDILDPDATTFPRLDALREVSKLKEGDLASPTVAGREPSPKGLGPPGDHQLSQDNREPGDANNAPGSNQ